MIKNMTESMKKGFEDLKEKAKHTNKLAKIQQKIFPACDNPYT